MLVPGHVCSLYVATGGANGPALGSDEKEIVLLDYSVIDVLTNVVVLTHQFLVRPTNGQTGDKEQNNKRDRTNTTDTATSTTSTNTDTVQQSTPEFSFAETVLQKVGKPLKDVIEQFDQEIRSQNIDPDSPTFRLITDGQLPLRQCLHPEACAKDIELPNYFCKFSDLRKEFVRFKSGDLSRALVPIKDIPNMPALPAQPTCIADMIADLQIEPTAQREDADFYFKESQDMVTVIRKMLEAGHKFESSEIINLTFEPGICSIDDEVDGQCIVRARGLPWQSSDQDIAKFFRGLNVAKGGVALCLSPQGRRNGEALIRFVSQEHRDMALKRHKHHIGNRYIEVYRATGEDFINVAGGASNEAHALLSKGAQVIIRMRGLPYLCTAKQVLDFFESGDDPCHVLDGQEGILFVKKPDGRATGDAFVLFAVEADAKKALSRHRESIGNRYIELFRSTTAEVQQVLNRSMDTKTYENNNSTSQPPLMAQLPQAVQFNLLQPQHVITSGSAKNCIRLRGLPYTIQVENILNFLEDFSKHIIFQGVHMVYNAQGQPSGEAFIQMDSEEAAYASAKERHNKYMVLPGKNQKYRYIEVFQCSGDDMNLVLNGGVSPNQQRKSLLLSHATGNAEAPVKTAKQLEKEAKKAAKLAKLQEKLDKKAAAESEAPKENKKEKVKEIKESAVYTANTAPGDKKDVSGGLPDAYSPKYVEAAWYSWWEKQGFFKPDYERPVTEENPKGTFIMVIPPPNVTGSLHLGHAITAAIEDSVTRWHRMNGRTTLWLPGCDHAGIATQVVVEKKIWREEGKTRHDLGREKFLEKVWDWRNEKGTRIYEQFRRMGASVDWTRTYFTMDNNLSRAVTEAFVRMYEDGTIYRSSRLVNWSCTLRSAISDIEVDKVEIPGRTFLSIPGYDEKVEFGVLISFAYKVENSDEEIIVATTRVETMLGDTAIAVHPNDKRYAHLHGKFCVHPFTSRRLPIVTDDFVETEFGTGAVKITPAHDPNDYEVGKRHNLPFITIFNDDGIIVGDCGKFTGMKRFQCRKEILITLKEIGLYRDTINNPMVVPICSRSKDVVEPIIKPQWYVKCDDMATKAIDAVQTGELKIIPDTHSKTWYHWMEGIRDWCISRQLWWGHRIPAYRVTFKDAKLQAAHTDEWVVGRTETEARANACKKYNVADTEFQLQQDEDVLDTWFSSALVTFAAFGWPDKTPDLEAFYPNHLLETGHDILFFWVARMVFFGQKLLGKLPFKEVFMHPIIRDAHGRKMSKSLGNVIDPMDVITGISLEDLNKSLYNSNLDPKEIEKAIAGQKQDFPNGIPECGSDAMRFALCSYNLQSRDINLDIMRVQGYRFFCNKLWNATKFALMYFDGTTKYKSTVALTHNESNMDKWILSRLAMAVEAANNGFSTYEFNNSTAALYSFWLYDLCDVYLECLKPVFFNGTDDQKASARQTLFTCLDNGLRLISPFMPFISEELYQRLPREDGGPVSICIAPYPVIETCPPKDEEIEKEVELVQKTAKVIRSARSMYNLPNKTKTEAFILCTCPATKSILQKFNNDLLTTAYCSQLHFDEQPPVGCAILPVTGQCEVHLLLKGLIQADKELQKLEKKRTQLIQTVDKLNQTINASDYTTKVPAEIQQANTEKLSESEAEMCRINAAIESLKLM